MRLLDFFRASTAAWPRASLQSAGGGTLIVSPQQLEDALRTGNVSASGVAVTPETALRLGAVYGCVRLRSSPIATLPLDIKRRVDERTRAEASDHWAWQLLRRRPNRWQKPHQFKRMLQAHVLLRGNGYAYKVPGVGGKVQELIPLHPARVNATQLDDLTMQYVWTRKDGSRVTFAQHDILHLFGLTLDGFTGVTPITYARETIGLGLSMEQHLAKVMAKGARASGVLRTEKSLSEPAFKHLKESLAEFRAGEEKEGEVMLLEEGLDFKQISMSPEDLQWIEARKLSRSDIAMFFGVPPSMLGDNSGSDSNWGTGLEQKAEAFKAFTLEDDLTMWEEGVNADLLQDDAELYARFNRAALVRGDTDKRWASYVRGLQWGVYSPNEVRALEDMNPREDGDIYYPPPNTAGDAGASPGGGGNEPGPQGPK